MKGKTANVTIYFKNDGKQMMMFCKEKELNRILRKLKNSSWITDIKVLK